MARHHITRGFPLHAGPANTPGGGAPGIRLTALELYFHDFGTPTAAVTTSVCASQAVSAGANAVINGSLASNGVATFDVPRNVTASWTTASTLTIVGTDAYGATLISTVNTPGGSATTKAYKTVTRVTSSAGITVLLVGHGTVLGLPVASATAANGGFQVARGGAAADTGTLVGADVTNPSTAATGDVRGTFTPSTALNGATRITLLYRVLNPGSQDGSYGLPQFSG